MTITRDIIRVFYHTIMAVCNTVYIHLYWGLQKTESIILGSCFCWDHLQLGNSHIVSMIPGSGHSLYPVLAPRVQLLEGTKGHGRSINVPWITSTFIYFVFLNLFTFSNSVWMLNNTSCICLLHACMSLLCSYWAEFSLGFCPFNVWLPWK